MSRPSNANTGAVNHVIRYPAGTTNYGITYKKAGFTLTVMSDTNYGSYQDNGPVRFKKRKLSVHYVPTKDKILD